MRGAWLIQSITEANEISDHYIFGSVLMYHGVSRGKSNVLKSTGDYQPD